MDDNKSALKALSMFLQQEFSLVKTVSNPNLLIREMELVDYDVVLLDMNFKAGASSGNEGIFWLNEIKGRHPNTEVVMITAYGEVGLAVRALKEGAADFVLKPWDNEKLTATLLAACRLRKSNVELRQLRSRENDLRLEMMRDERQLLGQSPVMLEVFGLLGKVAPTDANVLILGENGTGKELLAKEIHRLSGRKDQLMIPVDLGSLTETLFESELFGHRKGAFTDAKEDKTGKFVLANGGTLFLDEIGNLPLHLQSKLLTVLQNREVIPVGSNQAVPLDIRLISATNKNINQMIADGLFREDLLYRLNTIQITLPPLRLRADDIDLIAGYYLELYARKYNKPGLKLSRLTIDKLHTYNWPGNVRELQHAMERAVILCEQKIISPDNFHFSSPSLLSTGHETLEAMESKLISETLMRNQNNLSAAAQQLGITRQTLYNKIKRYGL